MSAIKSRASLQHGHLPPSPGELIGKSATLDLISSHLVVSQEYLTINGPVTEAIPYMAPRIPIYVGRLARGALAATINNAPENMPALPKPAMARPTIKAVELTAEPQTALPTSNQNMAMMKIHFAEKKVYSLP